MAPGRLRCRPLAPPSADMRQHHRRRAGSRRRTCFRAPQAMDVSKHRDFKKKQLAFF